MTDNATILNPLLTPTWNRHKLNGTETKLPDLPMAEADAVDILVPEGFLGVEPQDFDDAWAAWEQKALEATSQRITVKSTDDVDDAPFQEFKAAAKDPLDVPARGAMPRGAIDYALGDAAAEWMMDTTMACALVKVPAYKNISEALVVRVKGENQATAVASLDVIVGEGATCNLVLEADSPVRGTGVVGINLRIIAEANARVNVKQMQTLDDTWTYIECFETKVANDAKITVDQTYLGGKVSYIGNGHALQGFRSAVDIDTAYLATGSSTLDFNYLIRQFGKQSNSKLIANGVLAGQSTKNLRGTIDLIHGAKGAKGHELETVLLTNQGVHNRSLPIILCDEDDVQGDHGATIGHVPADHRYYMGSRGLSDEQIDALFLRSSFERALVHAHDAVSRAAVSQLAAQVLGASLEDFQILDPCGLSDECSALDADCCERY